ncbi:MAG: rhodanese-like domain-containing protein [Thermoleophilia bacterium]
MLFRQFVHDDLGCASYLVGDEDAGVAAVVDPGLDVDDYLRVARYLGVRIEHVLETHTHADHVSGHGRLHEATGATIHVHAAAGAEHPHEPFEDGWELALGDVLVRAVHTPGHRPEHTAFALIDTARGPEPWAVLTGDSLFVGDVARPDLAVEAEDGARDMFRSLSGALLTLPPETEVWPGHLGGSMCGGPGMSLKISSTIGYERDHNPLLTVGDEDEFVRRSLAGLGPQPPNVGRIVDLNRGPLALHPVTARPMTPRQVQRRQAAGALVVDVRSDVQFDDAHIPGAVSITVLRSGFGTRLGWLAPEGVPIVVVGRDDADARGAARLAAAVGIDDVTGYLAGGMTAWREEGRPEARIPRLPIGDLRERLAADPALQLLDVRDDAEWRRAHIPGALHTPYHALSELPAGLDPEAPVAVVCASGQRAGIAASLLRRLGAAEVVHVTGGGVGAWERAGGPVARPA